VFSNFGFLNVHPAYACVASILRPNTGPLLSGQQFMGLYEQTMRQQVNFRFLFLIFAFLLISGTAGCEKKPSTENKVPPAAQATPPQNETPSEEDHPGTGQMAEISAYKERLKTNPKDLEALIFLGNSNFDIKRYEKAKELYIQALMIDAKNPSVRTDLASCFRNLGQTDQAIVELRTVLALTPGHPPALFNLGVILSNDKGDKKAAIQSWKELLKRHPESPLSHGLAEKIALLQNEGGAISP
jgi:cytochrome c-type biogenesis protein CcmH/NrfG